MILLPLLALMGLMIYGRSRSIETHEEPLGTLPCSGTAWLDADDGQRIPLPVNCGILQIGQHADNDVCLGDAGLDHHHAVIERTLSTGFVITDVSHPDGPGLLVNGERRMSARLASGDVVELGSATLRFGMAA